MPTLDDGTVLPSFYGVVDKASETPGAKITMSDGLLRVGEVVNRYLPGSDQNPQGTEAIYVVNVNHRDGNGALTRTPYRCVIGDGFGGMGDHIRFGLRSRSAKTDRSIGDGSIVLIACINGDKASGVIVSCLRHMKRTVKDPKENKNEKGRFFDFEYNGTTVKIGDDGALTIVVNGATKNDGTADERDENNAGSTISIAANGNVTISDAKSETIVFDTEKKTITIDSDTTNATAQTAWKIIAPESTIGPGGSGPHVHITKTAVELGGAEGASVPTFVALAPNVEARLTALEQFAMIHTHIGVTPGPGVTGPAPGAPVSVGPVSAKKVKGV